MLQASLRQPCSDLQPLADSTGATLLRWALASVRDYRICKDRHAALVDAIAPTAVPIDAAAMR